MKLWIFHRIRNVQTELRSRADTYTHSYTQHTHIYIHTHAYTDKSKQILVTLTHYYLKTLSWYPFFLGTHLKTPSAYVTIPFLYTHTTHTAQSLEKSPRHAVSPLTESVRLKLVPLNFEHFDQHQQGTPWENEPTVKLSLVSTWAEGWRKGRWECITPRRHKLLCLNLCCYVKLANNNEFQ